MADEKEKPERKYHNGVERLRRSLITLDDKFKDLTTMLDNEGLGKECDRELLLGVYSEVRQALYEKYFYGNKDLNDYHKVKGLKDEKQD